MDLELYGSQILKNSKTPFESSKKIGTKNLDVDHYEIYKCEKNQSNTPCILGSAKNLNFEIVHCSL
jgi:hypothetical protein